MTLRTAIFLIKRALLFEHWPEVKSREIKEKVETTSSTFMATCILTTGLTK